MKERLIKAVATFFFVGYLPLMPGTWGSLAGATIYLLVRDSTVLTLSIFALLLSLGMAASGKAAQLYGKKDDKRIVIDEVCGIFLLYLLIPYTKLNIIIGFFLFRLFDVVKIYPAKKLERLPGSWGIMADDIVAALYAFLILSLISLIKQLFC